MENEITVFNSKITYVTIWYVNSLDYWNKRIAEQENKRAEIRKLNEELDNALETLGMGWFAKWTNSL